MREAWADDYEEVPEGPTPRPNGAHRAPEIAIRWHGDAEPAEPEWLVKRTIPQVSSGLMPGQWGGGKTFVGLDFAASVMTGSTFAGRKVMRTGGVLFVAAEGAFEIPIRLRGIVEGKLGSEQERLPFAWIEACPTLTAKGALEALVGVARHVHEQMLAEHSAPLVLVIIDTVAAAAGFRDENAASEGQLVMNVLAGLARALGACVLGIDHFGKLAETGTRGSSAKEAAADFVLALLGERDLAGNVTDRRLAIRKVRGAPSGAEISFDLRVVELGTDRDGEPVTTCVVDWRERGATESNTTKAADKPWPRSLQIFRRAFDAAIGEHGAPTQPFGADGPTVVAVDYEHVRREFYSAYPADGETERQRLSAKRAALHRNAKDAQGRGLLVMRDSGETTLAWRPDGGEQPHG